MLNVPEAREAIAAALNRPASFDSEAAAATFRSVTQAKEGPTIVITEPAPLTAPGSRGYPDDFYRRVAAAYYGVLLRPVVAVAAEAGVPRSTAARWVKEARRRGFIEPAPAPGKAS